MSFAWGGFPVKSSASHTSIICIAKLIPAMLVGVPLARQGSPSCVVLYSLRQPGAADLLRSTPTGSLIGKKSEKIIMNPPGKMRQNPPYICLPKLKPPLKMKGNPGHIEDIYAIKYIRHNGVYILWRRYLLCVMGFLCIL